MNLHPMTTTEPHRDEPAAASDAAGPLSANAAPCAAAQDGICLDFETDRPTHPGTVLLVAQLHELSRQGDEATALDRMLEQVVYGFGAVSGCLAVVDYLRPGHLVITAGVDLPPGAWGARVALGTGVLGTVAAAGQPRLLRGARPGAVRRGRGAPASSICWPMTINSRLIGALSINRDAGAAAFTQLDVERGCTFVTVLALLVDNLSMRSQQQLRIDQLSTLNAQILAVNRELKAAQAQLPQSDKRG